MCIKQDYPEESDLLEGSGKAAVDVLRLIQKRLKAEIQMKDNLHLRLLATLVREEINEDDYGSIIRKALKTIEQFKSFSAYLDDGIDHLSTVLRDQSTSSSLEKGRDQNLVTLQKMRDIKLSMSSVLGQFQTGLVDECDTFSTSPEDYATSADAVGN